MLKDFCFQCNILSKSLLIDCVLCMNFLAEALSWKLEGTSLKNKKKNWNSDDEWEFTNHSQSTIVIKNLSKNKILTMDDYRNVDFIAMEIDQDEKLNLQWRIGKSNF